MLAPMLSVNFARVARRAVGTQPIMPTDTLRVAGPEIRTIPTPPRPGGVAMAAMVSALARGTLCTLLLGARLDATGNAPLLQDG